jgi:hypothetical protein
MIEAFFIWCSGADKNLLAKCEDSVRTKHIGIGTLVLIPAILGCISMTYALSTIDKIAQHEFYYIFGGIVWGAIVFAFDRYIVSTHRKQLYHKDEFKNITFYLRLFFAIVLGIIISHPFVLMYFEGSITERIIKDKDNSIVIEEKKYLSSYDTISYNLRELIETKRCYEKLLTAEQSGTKLDLPCGSSSGIPNIKGNFPRTRKIEELISNLKNEIEVEQKRINLVNDELIQIKNNAKSNIDKHTSFDYLKREVVLTTLKKENPIIGITEFMLILAFMLVDILPLIFKTFSPFSMYDKIQYDELEIIKSLNTDSRKKRIQEQYDLINTTSNGTKNIDKE